jgi:hypothetical protein
MNESQLEQIINHQRVLMIQLHSKWLDIWERNLDLREHILDLEKLLDRHGIDYTPLPAPPDHPTFQFMEEAAAPRS